MSTFEEYDTTCENYDSQRVAMGADIIGNMLESRCATNIQDIRLLDAGCGTGNYAKALLKYGIGYITLLDGSFGMLAKAKAKLVREINDGKVEDVIQATLPNIPFNEGRFDAAMFNAVLHHVDQMPDGESFPNIQKTLKEARRVLKEDGVLCITSILASWMYLDWFTNLQPVIANRYTKKLPGIRQWEAMLQSAGFQQVHIMTVFHKLPEDVYRARRNPYGPTIKSWRDTDSYWACATDDEIRDIERQVKEIDAKGLLKKFVDDNDKLEGYFRVLLVVAQ